MLRLSDLLWNQRVPVVILPNHCATCKVVEPISDIGQGEPHRRQDNARGRDNEEQ